MIRFLLGEPKFGIAYLKIYEIRQKSLFKEKVHAILLKIFEGQDSYADLNTIISDFKIILAPAYPNSCIDSLISIFLVTDPFYYKCGTLLFISTIVKNLEPSTHHLPRLALLFAGGVIFVYLM